VKNKINGTTLKIIAIIAMTFQHAVYLFYRSNELLYMISKIIGSITFPIMCFCIVEGFTHTKNIKKYIGRLTILAIISHFAYTFYKDVNFPSSIIFTLLCGLVSIYWYEKVETWDLKITGLIFLTFISILGDGGIFGVLLILSFYFFKDNRTKQILGFTIVCLLRILSKVIIINPDYYLSLLPSLGVFLSIPLFIAYNGKKGGLNKFFFYIYYPSHLIILRLIYLIIF